MDDGPGVELASGIWNHQQLWLSERSELDADDLAFRDVDRVGGIDHLFLPGAIAIGAGRIGDIGRLYLHDGGGSGGAATVVADASGSDRSERRRDERIGGDAEHRAGWIYRRGGGQRNRIGELRGGGDGQRSLLPELLRERATTPITSSQARR